jgi:hypothetical protein
MYLFILLVVATIMAVFGLIGFIRVTRASVLLLGIMLGGLIFLRVFGEKLVKFVNAGWAFVRSGGSSGGSPSLLVNPQDPAAFFLLVFYGFVLMGLGLGLLRSLQLQGRFSFSGMLIGLINGYIVAAYTVDVLFPSYAILPVPIQVPGMTPPIPPPGVAMPAGPDVWNQLMQGLSNLASNPAAPVIIALMIFVFIILASRLSGKKG